MVQGRGIQVKHSDFTELRTERSIFREAELEKEEESTQRKNSRNLHRWPLESLTKYPFLGEVS